MSAKQISVSKISLNQSPAIYYSSIISNSISARTHGLIKLFQDIKYNSVKYNQELFCNIIECMEIVMGLLYANYIYTKFSFFILCLPESVF